MRPVLASAGLALLAGCAHTPEAPDDMLVTTYSVRVESALPGQRVTVEEVSTIRTAAHGDEVTFVFLEGLPAGSTDLARAEEAGEQTLMVGLQPSRLDEGRVSYEVYLGDPDDHDARPFGVGERPRLVVVEGETATVHLAQEAGDIYSRLIIELTSHAAPE